MSNSSDRRTGVNHTPPTSLDDDGPELPGPPVADLRALRRLEAQAHCETDGTTEADPSDWPAWCGHARYAPAPDRYPDEPVRLRDEECFEIGDLETFSGGGTDDYGRALRGETIRGTNRTGRTP